MEVKNLILYQVATDRYYKVGDKFVFGKQLNYQGARVLDGDKLIKGRLYDSGYNYVNKKFKLAPKNNLVLNLSEQLEEYDFIVRELAFEEVRKQSYSNCPSRLRCMFLTDSKEQCLKGVKTFYQKGHGTFFQAVAVKLTGTLFYAISECAIRAGLSYNDYVKMAHKYWSQSQEQTDTIKEILFEGEAEIVEILDEFEYKK